MISFAGTGPANEMIPNPKVPWNDDQDDFSLHKLKCAFEMVCFFEKTQASQVVIHIQKHKLLDGSIIQSKQKICVKITQNHNSLCIF